MYHEWLVMEHARRVRVLRVMYDIMSSTSSCGSLVIAGGRRVGISEVPPKRNRSILALPLHQTLAVSNSKATVVVTRYDE